MDVKGRKWTSESGKHGDTPKRMTPEMFQIYVCRTHSSETHVYVLRTSGMYTRHIRSSNAGKVTGKSY